MRWIDRALGGFAFWRAARGGFWECWSLPPHRSRWYGPFEVPYGERMLVLGTSSAAILSMVRAKVSELKLPGVDPDALSLTDIAKPHVSCDGTPVVEDRR